MEKRLLLAVLLMGAVVLITNLLFPPEPVVEPTVEGEPAVATAPAPATPRLGVPALPATAPQQADSVVVSSPLYRFVFSTQGAALLRAELLRYPSYVEEGSQVQLVPAGVRNFMSHRLVVGGDTIDLQTLPFQADVRSVTLGETDPETRVRFRYGGEGNGLGAEIIYTFRPDLYLIGVQGRVTGLGGRRATLLTELGPGIAPHEDPRHRSERELAVVVGHGDDVERLQLSKVEERQALAGPYAWAGIKDKYFLAALIAGDRPRFGEVVVDDLPDAQQIVGAGEDAVERAIPQAEVTSVLPLGADGAFAFDAYLGPQDYDRLAAIGFDLEQVTPYGYRWLQPVIRPFAGAILWVLNVLHNTLGVAYGWVLVLFGVLMRLLLWPLNAKAMRAQMKNMAVQPLMQEIREKYKDNPQKQQEEMMRLYREHGFNPIAGCLPMLLPFPVLITLFFVFQNTIVFRGADFLWLPDLSLPDPLYLLPFFLVISGFALQWVSAHLSGMEQNPQMKMMMYVMPVVMGVIFFQLPAGLNLYYATTNVATIPQQILIAKERRRVQEALKKPNPERAPASAGAGGGGKPSAKRRAKRRG